MCVGDAGLPISAMSQYKVRPAPSLLCLCSYFEPEPIFFQAPVQLSCNFIVNFYNRGEIKPMIAKINKNKNRQTVNKQGTDIDSKQSPSQLPQSLSSMLTAQSERMSAYKVRRDEFVYESIHPADIEKYEASGWSIHKESKTRVRIKRLKAHDRLLEDQVWCLFYRMGYPELNGARFKVKYTRQDGSSSEKQIDVFAKDDETVIVVECKSRETRGRRTLQKDLHETESLQKPIATAIRQHYGSQFKPKILWAYVTNNIIWSEPDLERAGSINVRVITENEMQYFDAFIKHMGPAGRYQFLAEFLENQDIPGLSNIKVPAIRGKLGGRPFYSFVITPRHLLKIAFVNHQALNHPDGRPAYQRMVSPSRIREIEGFIKAGGYFPTNILINFTKNAGLIS